jgi:predicted nucleic acid-binding Zn finger protein
MQKGSIVLKGRSDCNEVMAFLIVLAAGSAAAIAGTGIAAARDNYRRVPTRRV